jgi:hypothetical protein
VELVIASGYTVVDEWQQVPVLERRQQRAPRRPTLGVGALLEPDVMQGDVVARREVDRGPTGSCEEPVCEDRQRHRRSQLCKKAAGNGTFGCASVVGVIREGFPADQRSKHAGPVLRGPGGRRNFG